MACHICKGLVPGSQPGPCGTSLYPASCSPPGPHLSSRLEEVLPSLALRRWWPTPVISHRYGSPGLPARSIPSQTHLSHRQGPQLILHFIPSPVCWRARQPGVTRGHTDVPWDTTSVMAETGQDRPPSRQFTAVRQEHKWLATE